jgi:hypothetical protein
MLTVLGIEAAKPKEKSYKLSDGKLSPGISLPSSDISRLSARRG